MIVIFTRELIKIGISLVGGLLLGLVVIGTSGGFGYYLLLALYVLGLVYSITTVGPWLLSLVASLLKFIMTSIIFKSLLGFIIVLIALPVGLAIMLTVGCLIGLFNCIKNLVNTFPGMGNGYGYPNMKKKNRSWAGNSGIAWGDDLLSGYGGQTGGHGANGKFPTGSRGNSGDDMLF